MEGMTAEQVIKVVLWICAAISAVGAAVAVIVKAVTAAKAPTKQLEERMETYERSTEKRLGDLEDAVEKHVEYFGNDKKRLDGIEEGNRVTQRALLALLSHGIDGNDVEGLKKAKNELQQYLIDK